MKITNTQKNGCFSCITNGSARRLLQLIEQNPEMVEEIEYASAKG
ncbi:hypothetical protein ACNNMU_09430 [Aerococcus viridans]